MNPKSAKIALLRAIVVVVSLSLFITKTEAQMIGHLGVATEPIPLVQAKRPQRKLVTRNLNRPNPASKDLQADVSGLDVAGGKGTGTSQNAASNASGVNSGTVVAVITPPKPSPAKPPVEAKPTPTTPAKPAVSPFEESLAKAEALHEKGDARAAVDAFRQALALKADSMDAQLGLAESLFDIMRNIRKSFRKIRIRSKLGAAEPTRCMN